MADAFLDLKRAITLLRVLFQLTFALALQYLPTWAHKNPVLPVRIRQALERFGLTYLKLGQFLATRFDFLPADVCELGLFDQVEPMSFDEVRDVIEKEFQQPSSRYFSI